MLEMTPRAPSAPHTAASHNADQALGLSVLLPGTDTAICHQPALEHSEANVLTCVDCSTKGHFHEDLTVWTQTQDTLPDKLGCPNTYPRSNEARL